MLVQRGVDVREPLRDGRRAIDIAAGHGAAAMVAVLIAGGAPRPALTGLAGLVAALLAGDRAAVDQLTASDPDVLRMARDRAPGLVARTIDIGRAEAIPLLVSCGFDVNGVDGDNGPTALHRTASHGDIATARVLLSSGADPDRRDTTFGATPLGWAEYGHQRGFADFIRPHTGATGR